MKTFTALKGTLPRAPPGHPPASARAYLLFENGLCAGFQRDRFPLPGWKFSTIRGKIITPGLVDTPDLHAPKYSYCGTAIGSGAAGLAAAVATTPEEAHYADPAYAVWATPILCAT